MSIRIMGALAMALAIAAATLAGAATRPTISAAEASKSLAPSGRLRVAINYGNTVLAQKNATTGELTGASVVLAKTLGERLHVPVDLVPFPAAGQVFAAMDQNQWDLAFLAIEPERAQKIDFSPPYVVIDGTYLVFKSSPYQSVADIDRDGVRIAVAKGAAYDLYLSRNLKHATLERAPTSPAAVQLFLDGKLDAAAGVRQFLADTLKTRDDVRILKDSYSRIEQAIAVPLGHEAGAAYIRGFLEEMKASGKIRAALEATGQDGSVVAP
jgi:polar amino acid transport system substrate-binding protein